MLTVFKVSHHHGGLEFRGLFNIALGDTEIVALKVTAIQGYSFHGRFRTIEHHKSNQRAGRFTNRMLIDGQSGGGT